MRKFIVFLAALALSIFTLAGLASAQEGQYPRDRADIVEVSASCNADGTQSVTFIITNTSDEHNATITELSATIGPIEGAFVGQVLAPGESTTATITTSGDQTGTVSLHVELEFVVDETKTYDRHDSDDVQFPGGCDPVPPVTVTTTVTNDIPVPFPVFFPVPVQVEQPVLIQAPTPVVVQARFTG